MRLFVAVELPLTVRNYLYELQKKIGNKNAKVKWIAKKNIHLTMKFLGNVEDNKVEEIKSRLRKIGMRKFEVKLGNLGFFPGENNIRVIWVGINPEENILELQKKIDGELLDLFSEEQKFKTHLTLGRVKTVKDKKKLIEGLNIGIEKINFSIDRFFLVQSTLRKDGPEYNKIDEFRLN